MNHIADNQDALLDYLYEEGDPAERLKIATHLQACAECSVAVLEFQNVRGMLTDWTPPDAQLGFRVVRDREQSPSATVIQGARGGRWRGWGPATNQEKWGPTTAKKRWQPVLQAAAAVLVFAAGMAVSQLNVDYEDGVLRIATQSAEPDIPVFSGRDIQLPAQRVSAEPAPAQAASSEEIERLLQRVRAMIDQSEQRQKGELALRLSQVARELDTQHQADLLRIQQDFGQQQEATMDYLVRTSGGTR